MPGFGDYPFGGAPFGGEGAAGVVPVALGLSLSTLPGQVSVGPVSIATPLGLMLTTLVPAVGVGVFPTPFSGTLIVRPIGPIQATTLFPSAPLTVSLSVLAPPSGAISLLASPNPVVLVLLILSSSLDSGVKPVLTEVRTFVPWSIELGVVEGWETVVAVEPPWSIEPIVLIRRW